MRMKRFLLLTLLSLNSYAQNVVLGHFDAFDGASFNNSEIVAKAVANKLRSKGINVKLCAMKTSFKEAYTQFDQCITNNSDADLFLPIGETGCNLKAEFVGRNIDKTYGPDNLGEERNNTKIIASGEDFLSLRYPLPQMYCSLTDEEKNNLRISNNAGSFICNNIAYQARYNHPEKMIGFIHVPSNFCKDLSKTNPMSIQIIEKMVMSALNTKDNSPYIPHHSNNEEIPYTKNEIRRAASTQEDNCYKSFYKTIKGVDQRGIWPF